MNIGDVVVVYLDISGDMRIDAGIPRGGDRNSKVAIGDVVSCNLAIIKFVFGLCFEAAIFFLFG